MKKTVIVILVSFLSGLGGAYFYVNVIGSDQMPFGSSNKEVAFTVDTSESSPIHVNTGNIEFPENMEDFKLASENATASVVYIKNISSRSYSYSFFDWYFGEGGRSIETVSSGSGVILSPDGYIVTNNHVVKGADKIEVVHGRQNYIAKLVGTDPSSDLAVIKIEANGLPAITTGSSKELAVGEWVLAIGNPFNLTSTVTAGIVSAKGRELNILESKFPIESFIQTDAAINPGNSGGALVNKSGKLVGINTAIISKTGSYAGYGFAVPVDIVRKIVNDIIEYGEVQKAFIGAGVADLTADVAKKLDLDIKGNGLNGVVVNYVQSNGTAAKAGIKEGDVLLSIDDNKIESRSDFEEVISYYSPGDVVTLNFLRNDKKFSERVTLTNREGTTDILMREIFSSEYLGADLESVSKVEREVLDIEYGVKIVKVFERGLMTSLGLNEGFIITDVNYTKIREPKDLVDALTNYRGRVKIEGVDKTGKKGYYTFYLR